MKLCSFMLTVSSEIGLLKMLYFPLIHGVIPYLSLKFYPHPSPPTARPQAQRAPWPYLCWQIFSWSWQRTQVQQDQGRLKTRQLENKQYRYYAQKTINVYLKNIFCTSYLQKAVKGNWCGYLLNKEYVIYTCLLLFLQYLRISKI